MSDYMERIAVRFPDPPNEPEKKFRASKVFLVDVVLVAALATPAYLLENVLLAALAGTLIGLLQVVIFHDSIGRAFDWVVDWMKR